MVQPYASYLGQAGGIEFSITNHLAATNELGKSWFFTLELSESHWWVTVEGGIGPIGGYFFHLANDKLKL